MMRNDERVLRTALEIALEEKTKEDIAKDIYSFHIFSDAHSKKMEKLFKSSRRKARRRTALRVASAFVGAMILIPVLLYNTVGAFKSSVLEWVQGIGR